MKVEIREAEVSVVQQHKTVGKRKLKVPIMVNTQKVDQGQELVVHDGTTPEAKRFKKADSR